MKKLALFLSLFMIIISCTDDDNSNNQMVNVKDKLTVTFIKSIDVKDSHTTLDLVCSQSDWINPNGKNTPVLSIKELTGKTASFTTANKATVAGINYGYKSLNDTVATPYKLHVFFYIGNNLKEQQEYDIKPTKQLQILKINYEAK